MKYTFSLVALLMSSFASQLSAQSTIAPKLSPMTSLFLKDKKQLVNMLPQNYIYKQDALGQKFLSAMIKVNSSINDVDIYTIGAKVGTKAGMVWTVSIPVSQLEQFLKISGIEYVALDEPLSNTMDAARLVTRTDSVHKGFAPLGTAYYGNNTVVGIIDAGFDYNHPTLRDTTGAQWRIKRVWEQKTIGTAPTGFSFGHEMKDSTTIKTKATDLLKFSHGTHVAGIAAGSGWGSAANSQYRGIAFGSDMVLVGITPDTSQWTGTGMSDIIDGMNYIYQYAASVAKPAVANLSWGGPLGPHDGTSLFSQACDALTGKGKIFVCSGGNNGSNNIHLAKTFTISDTIINSELIPNSAINKVWMDIWGDSSKKFCAQISLYNGSIRSDSTGYICLDNTLRSFSLLGSDGDTCFIDVVPDSSTFNGKPRMFFRMQQKSKNMIYVSVKGKDGKINMWTGYVDKTTGYYGAFANSGLLPNTTAGNADFTVGDIAGTKSAIAVGSFASKVVFTNLSAGSISYASYVGLGRRAPYSSKGPTVDGRTKPDIASPGLMIGSGVSSFDSSYMPTGVNYNHSVAVFNNPIDNKDYYYSMLTGTSMASPVVAGIVALMLDANPNLTPQKTIEILKNTALHDIYTGAATPTGNNLWGHGKVNAFAAVKQALEALDIASSNGIHPIECRLYPNPNSGNFTLVYSAQQNQNLNIELIDLTGKIVLRKKWAVSSGTHQTNVDASSLSKGLYFTRVSDESHKSISFKTFIQ